MGETWEWTAVNGWTQRHPAMPPAARGMTAMTYDASGRVVLMYGGRETVGGTVDCGDFGHKPCSADTWTWDGTVWTQLHPGKFPPPFLPTMTYDNLANNAILYNINSNVPETWAWDGTSWTLKASGAVNPTPNRESPVMVFDPTSRHVLMFDGFTPGGGNVATMWSWSGETWASLGVDAPERGLHAAENVDRKTLLAYEGPAVLPPNPPGTSVTQAHTWIWDGSNWTQLHPMHEPSAEGELFADPKSHQVLLVGNNIRGNALEIWAWNGADWHQLL